MQLRFICSLEVVFLCFSAGFTQKSVDEFPEWHQMLTIITIFFLTFLKWSCSHIKSGLKFFEVTALFWLWSYRGNRVLTDVWQAWLKSKTSSFLLRKQIAGSYRNRGKSLEILLAGKEFETRGGLVYCVRLASGIIPPLKLLHEQTTEELATGYGSYNLDYLSGLMPGHSCHTNHTLLQFHFWAICGKNV